MASSTSPRIAIGAVFTESNQLGGKPTTLADFARSELLRGEEILGAGSYSGGMVAELHRGGAEIVPLLVATAQPGGPIASACYRELRTELLSRLASSWPLDGLLMPLHGAAVADGVDDVEGDLLGAAREIVGPDVPIVATLDLHAHITQRMISAADALVALETYPHRDSFATGGRGARLCLGAVRGSFHPCMAAATVPLLVSAIRGSTEGDDPFAQVLRNAKAHESRPGILSTSALLVHPYLDVPELGGGGVAVTDGSMPEAVRIATEIASCYWEKRRELEGRLWTPAEAVARGMEISGGPVVLVETADCCGGGAAGDSVHALRALLEAKVPELSLVPVVDPEAAAACVAAGTGAEVELQLGHKVDPKWGSPVRVRGKVGLTSEGRFRYQGGTWEGVEAEMGKSAVLEIGAVQVLVTTNGTYDWRDEQFRSVGLDPARAKFVVAKNPMNYRMAYGAFAKEMLVLDTPGPTPPTLRHVRYRRVERPYFPADQDIPGLTPRVFLGRSG